MIKFHSNENIDYIIIYGSFCTKPQKSKIQRNKKQYKLSDKFLDKQIMGKMPEWDLEQGPILSYAKPPRNTHSLKELNT